MNKLNKVVILILAFSLSNCSFSDKTGFWTGSEEEKRKISKLENVGNVQTIKAFSTKKNFSKVIKSKEKTIVGPIIKNTSWPMQGQNLQNSTKNFKYSGKNNIFYKKKIGNNKKDYAKVITSPIIFENNIILSDNNGSIYNLNLSGKTNWKKNIYKKINKKIYKILSYAYYNGTIYVSDNIGYLYAINSLDGEILWKKNYGIPFKSYIKISNDKIYLIDQDNKIICFKITDGSILWDLKTVFSSFVKSQNFLALAVAKNKYIFSINSSGDLSKVNLNNGQLQWSIPTLSTLINSKTDFFETSNIVIDKNTLFFSNSSSNTFSINFDSGWLNWQNPVNTNITPIVNGNNVFVLTKGGFLVNIKKDTGKILWSANILKNLKTKKKEISSSGFVLASNKIYITTSTGYLIVCSTNTGEVILSKKIAKKINMSPIISDEKIYILTESSKLLILN